MNPLRALTKTAAQFFVNSELDEIIRRVTGMKVSVELKQVIQDDKAFRVSLDIVLTPKPEETK